MVKNRRNIILVLTAIILACSLTGYAQYTYTQQSGTGYFVSGDDKADALEDTNELRMILDELGLLLEHSKYGDASYPADENTTPGTLDIFTDYYTKLEIDALGYITGVAWGDITGTLSNQTDLNTALGNKLANVSEDTTPELGGTLVAGDNNITGIGRASFTQELDNGSKSANFTIDFATDQKQKVTLTANTMTLTLDTTSVGVANYLLKIVNGGLATLTWAAETGSIYWPGGTEPTLTESGTDIVALYFDGTNWYCQASLDFK